MRETVNTAGMILRTADYAEYDRRMVVLTSEMGRITVFARGVRRQGSRHMAATEPLVFGGFKLFEGKSAYNLQDVEIVNYFEKIRSDMENMCYASYFADLTEHVTRENNDESEILKLLYRSLQALMTSSIDNRLVRSVFELKLVQLQGLYPGVPGMPGLLKGTAEAMVYLAGAQIKDLFSFKVNVETAGQLAQTADSYRKKYIPGAFKSLEVMQEMGYT